MEFEISEIRRTEQRRSATKIKAQKVERFENLPNMSSNS